MEYKMFDLVNGIPECVTAEWYEDRERAPHLEQAPHVGRLHTAAEYIRQAVANGARELIDIGAGDGGLLSLVKDLPIISYGYDLQPTNVQAATEERKVAVFLQDAVEGVMNGVIVPKVTNSIIAATEVLEHLIDPHGFLRATQSTWLVASSPWNETPESHYAFHLWAFDYEGYETLIQQAGFTVIEHLQNDDGFQIILGQRL